MPADNGQIRPWDDPPAPVPIEAMDPFDLTKEEEAKWAAGFVEYLEESRKAREARKLLDAAAPELYEELAKQRCPGCWVRYGEPRNYTPTACGDWKGQCDSARAALAKARGEL